MHPDLERLIRLQRFESFADDARRKIADHPQRTQAMDERLETARKAVAAARERLADCQTRRRADEKEVAVVQSRLTKFKDQLLEVKTNREYQAMQHEIEGAQTDIRTREDRILEIMLEADDLAAAAKRAETDLATVERTVASERQQLDNERQTLEAELDRTAGERRALAGEISPSALAIFEQIARGRRGWRSLRRVADSARFATCGFAPRSSTKFGETTRLFSVIPASVSFTSSPRRSRARRSLVWKRKA